MTKYILGGVFVTLGVIQIADWNQEKPEIGIPLTVVMVALWAYQITKDLKGGRR